MSKFIKFINETGQVEAIRARSVVRLVQSGVVTMVEWVDGTSTLAASYAKLDIATLLVELETTNDQTE